MLVNDAIAMCQSWLVNAIGLDDPLKAEGVDCSNPQPCGIHTQILDALLNLVCRAMRVVNGDDKLPLRFKTGKLVGDFVGQRPCLAAPRACNEEDAAVFENRLCLFWIQLSAGPREHHSTAARMP